MNKTNSSYDCIVIYQTIDKHTVDRALLYFNSICSGLKFKFIVAYTDISLLNNSCVLFSSSELYDFYICGNKNREFSAWNSISKIYYQSYKNLPYVFFNQTAFINREFYLRRLLRRLAIKKALYSNKICLFGELHNFNKNFAIPNNSNNEYINTSFFIIKGFFNIDLEDLSYDYLEYLNNNPEYFDFISNVVKGINSTVKWHKHGSLISNYEINLKVKSIILEHDLTTKARKNNIEIINIIPNLFVLFYLKILDKIYLKFKL